MLSGPKTLSGGWFSVTRQYWGERRVSSIRFVLVAVPIAFFICPPPISEPLNSNRRAKAKQLDESIGNTLVSRDRETPGIGYYFGVQVGCPVNRPLTSYALLARVDLNAGENLDEAETTLKKAIARRR